MNAGRFGCNPGSAHLEKVRIEASQLPPEEKQLLAIELIDLAWGDYDRTDDVNSEWDAEIAKRAAQVRSSSVPMTPWEAVKTSLSEKFGWDKYP